MSPHDENIAEILSAILSVGEQFICICIVALFLKTLNKFILSILF